MRQGMSAKSEWAENLFLLAWGSVFVTLFIMFCIQKYEKYTAKKTKSLPIKLPPITVSEETVKKIRYKKLRGNTLPQMEQPLFLYEQDSVSNVTIQPTKRRHSQETIQVAPILSSAISTLPTEIRFSDEFVYPAPPDSPYQLYPLPGAQKSQPIARVTIHGHSMLVYNTQFGVLTTHDLPDESHVAAHRHCLENGRVTFAKDVGLFKTHTVRTAGDGRIYATRRMTTQDGLTLHLFDTTEQHAHRGK